MSVDLEHLERLDLARRTAVRRERRDLHNGQCLAYGPMIDTIDLEGETIAAVSTRDLPPAATISWPEACDLCKVPFTESASAEVLTERLYVRTDVAGDGSVANIVTKRELEALLEKGEGTVSGV